MNTAKTIEIARQHLANDNATAYRAIMESAIRCSLSASNVKKYRAAMAQDLGAAA